MTDTGESTAAIRARMDDRSQPLVEAQLRAGSVLQRPNGMRDYYTKPGGACLTLARVRKLERAGVLQRIGVDTYGLA